MSKQFIRMNTATNSVMVKPKQHDYYYVGTKQGAATSGRITPFRDVVETPLGLVMNVFAISMGVLLPSGANKSLLQETRKFTRPMINYFRTVMAEHMTIILNKIVKNISGWVEVVLNDPVLDPEKERELGYNDMNAGAITLEEYRNMYYPNLPEKINIEQTLPKMVGQVAQNNVYKPREEGESNEDGESLGSERT